MHNPHNKTYLFVHVIWSVKNRERLLIKPVRTKLYEQILQQAKAKDICVLILNGVEDHVHCLLQLHPSQNISDIVHLLKGGSSFWLNNSHLIDVNFKWQDGYAAYSVSPSAVEKVTKYIAKQEEHHASKSLNDELNMLDKMNDLLKTTG